MNSVDWEKRSLVTIDKNFRLSVKDTYKQCIEKKNQKNQYSGGTLSRVSL